MPSSKKNKRNAKRLRATLKRKNKKTNPFQIDTAIVHPAAFNLKKK